MTKAPAASVAQVATIVLNWRRYDETLECLESLRTLRHPVRTYLVDNASDPQALAALCRRHRAVIPLPLEANLGFAEAMNHGMGRALADGATHLLLLNNDARVTPPLIDQLLALFLVQADAGIVGPSLRYPLPDGRIQAAGIDVNRLTGRVRLRSVGADPGELPPYPHAVSAVPGAALMVSAEVLRAVGMFNPGYFFYFEDIDLCLRAREAGYATLLEPTAVVYHKGGATMGRSPEQVYYGVRNQLWALAQHGTRLGRPLEVARRGFIAGLHLAQLLRGDGVAPGAGLPWLGRGIRDFRDGRFGPYQPAGTGNRPPASGIRHPTSGNRPPASDTHYH